MVEDLPFSEEERKKILEAEAARAQRQEYHRNHGKRYECHPFVFRVRNLNTALTTVLHSREIENLVKESLAVIPKLNTSDIGFLLEAYGVLGFFDLEVWQACKHRFLALLDEADFEDIERILDAFQTNKETMFDEELVKPLYRQFFILLGLSEAEAEEQITLKTRTKLISRQAWNDEILRFASDYGSDEEDEDEDDDYDERQQFIRRGRSTLHKLKVVGSLTSRTESPELRQLILSSKNQKTKITVKDIPNWQNLPHVQQNPDLANATARLVRRDLRSVFAAPSVPPSPSSSSSSSPPSSTSSTSDSQ